MDKCCAENLFFSLPTSHSQLPCARARCVLSLPRGSVEIEAPGGPCATDPVNRNRQEPSTPPGGYAETPTERQLTGSTPQAGQAERPRSTRYKAPHSLSYFFLWLIAWLIYPVSILVNLKMKKQTECHNEMNWLDCEVSTVVTNGLFAWWCQAE